MSNTSANLTTENLASEATVDSIPRKWLRRALPAVGLTMALALSACGTDPSAAPSSTNSETATSAIDAVPASDASSVAPVSGASASGPGQAPLEQATPGQPSPEQGSDNGAGDIDAIAPMIDSFWTPDSIDCHNGNDQTFTASWATTNAAKVTISIDGPGIYAEYPADGETSLPFNCSSSHSFLLTAHGENGETATRTVTLDPRNVQMPVPEGDVDAIAPMIDSFWTPDSIDCHNGNDQTFTASWATTNAAKVTISIDGPGIYAEYPADGETSLPFNCSSSHSFLLTAHGENGETATRTVTLDPRNVPTPAP